MLYVQSDELTASGCSNEEYLHTLLSKMGIRPTSAEDDALEKSLNDKILNLLMRVKIARYDELLHFVGMVIEHSSALIALQQVAVLINGFWVIKSEFLYPKNATGKTTGVTAETLCRARDVVLCQFTQTTYVKRNSITALVVIPPVDLKEMLNDIAVFERFKGWRLKLAPDRTFAPRFPEVAQRQKLLWDTKIASLSKRLMPSTSAESTIVATPIDSKEFDSALVSFVTDCLGSCKVITVSELRRRLNMTLSQSAPGHVLSGGVSVQLLISTLKNIGAVCVSLKWPKTMTDEAIYAAVDFNDGTEKRRRSFLAQFRDTNQQKKHIIKKNMQKDSETISDDDLASLLKDYCSLSKKGFFIIKFSKI